MSDDDINQLMDVYDKWNSRDRRQRLRARLEHKLRAKEQYARNQRY
jgi:hypothetical protein